MLAFFALTILQSASPAQFEHKGYFENRTVLYLQTTPQDHGRLVAESLIRYEPSFKVNSHLAFHCSLEARVDSHRQDERTWHLEYWDRSSQRPAFGVRELKAAFSRGPLTVEVGKQLIRWGKTDILNPTARFAPRDYLTVVDNEYLAVSAIRFTAARSDESLELVFSPRLTPSRIPLLYQRWFVLPAAAQNLPLQDAGAQFPGGSQFGARWNRLNRHFEYSFSFYQGFQHSPLLNATSQANPFRINVTRSYPGIRTYGADMAAPLPWLTLKTEAAWYQARSPAADEYLLYVVQVERQRGEWLFIGGYAGEWITTRRGISAFPAERGLARAFIGRASLTIDTNRSLVFEVVARQNGKGFYGKAEYSHALGQHWRITAGFVLIRGSGNDFLGRYHDNSFGSMAARYSF